MIWIYFIAQIQYEFTYELHIFIEKRDIHLDEDN